ncbi:MAG: class I SAM-dependent methyltransferase family protein [Candidatus Aenigmatarchaeota archaeon]
MSLKEILKDELTEEEMKHLRTSFSIVGDIAIIEVPEELENKEDLIGEALMKVHKNVNTVLKKDSERKGEFRLRDYQVIAGEEKTETVHKEFGCRIKIDLEKAYFSEREGKERQRIAEKIEGSEKILVMFAGVGPFPVVMCKLNQEIDKIYGVELNPDAYELMRENIRINKVSDKVIPILGDVRKEVPKMGEFDRILMPLPESAHKFLDLAFESCRERGIIHLYGIGEKEDLFGKLENEVEKIANEMGIKYRIKDRQNVLPFGVRKYKIRLDIEVLEK